MVESTGVRAHVITVSDRCAAGERADASGPVAVARLGEAGYVVSASVVGDGGEAVAGELRRAIQAGCRLILTTGGTGIGPRDRTPEGTGLVLDRELPGVAEALRSHGAKVAPGAVLSRGLAGVVDASAERLGSLVVNLPGSPQGVAQSLDVILPLVDHVLDQLTGGDH